MENIKKTEKASIIFMQLAMAFAVCLISANIFETKEIVVGPLTLTGGLIIFPLTYVICRVVCEVWGFKHSCFLICTEFIRTRLGTDKFLDICD